MNYGEFLAKLETDADHETQYLYSDLVQFLRSHSALALLELVTAAIAEDEGLAERN